MCTLQNDIELVSNVYIVVHVMQFLQDGPSFSYKKDSGLRITVTGDTICQFLNNTNSSRCSTKGTSRMGMMDPHQGEDTLDTNAPEARETEHYATHVAHMRNKQQG